MDRLIFTAASGAKRNLLQQEIHANNLANVNTQGFRADLENAIAQQVAGYGYRSRYIVKPLPSGIDLTSGAMQQTGRDLDVAIQGTGLIAISVGGREMYTRNGQIEIGAEGELTINGAAVLGDNGPIVLPPFNAVNIAEDGVISVFPEEGISDGTIEVDRLKLVDIPSAALTKDVNGFLVTQQTTNPPAEEVRVAAGFLEGSNISAVNEMTASIALSRQFEAQIKMIKNADDLATFGNRLLRPS